MTTSAKPLDLYEDERRFEYPNYFQHPAQSAAFCRLRLFYDKELAHYVAVVTESPDNEGLSISNGAERIAHYVCRAYDINPDSYTQIGHYLAGRAWGADARARRRDPESFVRHRLKPGPQTARGLDGQMTQLMFCEVQFELMTREEVEAMLGQPLEDRP